jgi:hypothetical protein
MAYLLDKIGNLDLRIPGLLKPLMPEKLGDPAMDIDKLAANLEEKEGKNRRK